MAPRQAKAGAPPPAIGSASASTPGAGAGKVDSSGTKVVWVEIEEKLEPAKEDIAEVGARVKMVVGVREATS